MTADQAGTAVTNSIPAFSAPHELTESRSAKRQKVSANGKRQNRQQFTLAENAFALQVGVDDQTLLELITTGRVGVHKSGSQQRRGGQSYDYRSHYRALRLNDGGREVLAFGTPERLTEKLATVGVYLCLDHRRAVLTVGSSCRQCGSREASAQVRVAF